MNILSTGDYLPSLTISIAQLELLIGLKKKEINIIVVGKFSDEILNKLEGSGITCIKDYPKSKIDFGYITRMKEYVINHNIEIIHAFNGQALRNTIIAVKKLHVKLITYMGSTSIHWHDPSAYFTYLSPRVDKIICNSDYVYKHVKNQLFWKNKKKAIRIFKGYNSKWFSTTAPTNIDYLRYNADTTIVCMAANYLKVKGIEYFIKATYHMNIEDNISILLIGDMRENSDSINKLIEKSPLKDKIHAVGFKPDPISFFKSIDIYVQTSNREGFGRAISEAMCCAKPIIMTDAGGCTELIDEKSGVIVPIKNPKAITKAISKLAENKSLRESMGKESFNRIKSNFHIDRTILETLDLYKTLYEELKN